MAIAVMTSSEIVPAELSPIDDAYEPKTANNCWRSSKMPTRRKCLHIVTQIFILTFFLGSLFGILQEDTLPGSEIFALLVLALSSYIGGKLISLIRLPPLLGMLIVGFLFRNLSFIPYYKDISLKWLSALKDIALVIILLRAGLGLDAEKLRKLKMVIFRLSFGPCMIETISSAIFTHFLLNLPWIWALMLGFIVSAVSPAVIVPSMLSLQERKLGFAKGIPTLVIAAASVDDVIAITGFTICLSVVFSEGNLAWTIVKGPLEPLLGFVLGAVFGVIFWYLPSKESLKPTLVYYRGLLLLFSGLCLMFVSKQYGMAGSGPLGCISLAFVSAMRWRKDTEEFASLGCIMGVIWRLVQPFLFGLIGAEVTIRSLQTNLGFSVLAISLGIVIRMIGTILVVMGTKLNCKEKIFVACAWLAKATVQAAIGGQALDYARTKNKGAEYEKYGEQVLTVAVLSIIMTAPIGAALIAVLAPVLLTKDEDAQESVAEDETDESGSTRLKVPDYGSFNHIQPSDSVSGQNDV